MLVLKKYGLIICYICFFIMALDTPCHLMFHKCINPINLIVCQIFGGDPNVSGNKLLNIKK